MRCLLSPRPAPGDRSCVEVVAPCPVSAPDCAPCPSGLHTLASAVSHEQTVTRVLFPRGARGTVLRCPDSGLRHARTRSRRRASRNSANPAAGRTDQQPLPARRARRPRAGRRPRRRPARAAAWSQMCGALLDVGVEGPGGHRAQVEGAGPEPADVADPRAAAAPGTRPGGPATRLLVAEAGADQRAPRAARRPAARERYAVAGGAPAERGGVLEAEDGGEHDARDHLARRRSAAIETA